MLVTVIKETAMGGSNCRIPLVGIAVLVVLVMVVVVLVAETSTEPSVPECKNMMIAPCRER